MGRGYLAVGKTPAHRDPDPAAEAPNPRPTTD
jgi:hypothetical protein